MQTLPHASPAAVPLQCCNFEVDLVDEVTYHPDLETLGSGETTLQILTPMTQPFENTNCAVGDIISDYSANSCRAAITETIQEIYESHMWTLRPLLGICA
jgi:hypothetical protein